MKKTNIILLILVVLVSAVVAIIYFANNSDTKKILRDFAVSDTASVDKIFMADKNNNTITLERKGDYWMVNGLYKARRDFVNVLLSTITRIEVSAPVPNARLDKVLGDLSVNGVKTEIYQNGKVVKTYYVGGPTDDNTGTYMILEGSSVPFILKIPGFNGFLSVRYCTELNEWRERQIFNYQIQDIAKASALYPAEPEESFIAISKGNNQYDLVNADGSKLNIAFDTLKVKEYLSRCKFIGFEAYIMDSLQKPKRDSLMQQPVIAKFSVENRKGEIQFFKTYRRQNINNMVNDDGDLYDFDIERLYGIINDKDVVILQYYIVDPVSFKKSDFLIRN